MKARLRLPLRPPLRDGFDEGDVMRLWRGIRAHRQQRRPVWWLGLAVAGAAAVALGLAVPRLTARGRSGPLHLASGGVPGMLVAEQEPQRLVMADGSAIVALPHTKVDVLANDAKMFLTAIRQGTVRIHVQPGGARRWVVECGPVSIEVVGTELTVERSAGQVVVAVVRGVVLVRGPRVPDHVQRLGAGDRLAIPTVEAPAPTLAPAEQLRPRAPTVAAPAPTAAEATVAPAIGAPPHGGADELIQRADAARRSGDLALAKRLLGQAIERANGAPAGAVAALTLARLTMQDDPAAAAGVLARALRAGMPQGLEEDARARLVEARARSDDSVGARQAAREYRQRFPQGARSREVQRWASE